MGISVEYTEWLLLHCFQVELEFGNVDCKAGKRLLQETQQHSDRSL